MKDGHGNFVNIHPTVLRGRMKSSLEENLIHVRQNVQFAFVCAKKLATNGRARLWDSY